ncbi:hypothetical protein NPIL_241481 [Nephila pilipes]|uniref:Uncharacterized protein n=1 Tax=Nephila pilipes TaxID=299642 RepID=A0A8X6NNE6_NEPPI|nr:hypothetical protein NPIL_241481 [Nephila pilipes]
MIAYTDRSMNQCVFVQKYPPSTPVHLWRNLLDARQHNQNSLDSAGDCLWRRKEDGKHHSIVCLYDSPDSTGSDSSHLLRQCLAERVECGHKCE